MPDTLAGLLPYAQTVLVVVAAGIAIWQLNAGLRSRYFDGLQRVYEELSSTKARADREAIFALPEPFDPTRPTFAEELALVRTVTPRYDFVGHLVVKGILPASYVVPVYYLQIVRVWNKTKPYIDYIRCRTGTGAAYHQRFEKLSHRCERYRWLHNRKADPYPPHPPTATGGQDMTESTMGEE